MAGVAFDLRLLLCVAVRRFIDLKLTVAMDGSNLFDNRGSRLTSDRNHNISRAPVLRIDSSLVPPHHCQLSNIHPYAAMESVGLV